MKKFLALVLSTVFAVSAFGAVDNFYTRIDYPQPRVKQASNDRVFPAFLAYQTDGNGTISPVGPIVSNSFYYATPLAVPVSTTVAVVLKAAVLATTNYVSGVSISNTSATGTVASIKDGSTVMWSGYIPATTGQVIVRFDPPLKGTASTSTNFVVESGGANIYVSAQGFIREFKPSTDRTNYEIYSISTCSFLDILMRSRS